jgi:sensor histidine kinase YesM
MRFSRFLLRVLPQSLTSKIILLVFALVSFSITLGGILFYTRSVGLIRTQSETYARNLCLNLSRDLDNYIGEMERICRIILGNPEIQNILERRLATGYSDYQYLLDQELAKNLTLSFTSVRDSFIIQLFDEKGYGIYADPDHFMSYQQTLFENPWTLARKDAIDERRLFIVPALYSGLTLFSRRPAFYVIRPVKRVSDNRILGYMTVTADSQLLLNILRRYALTLQDAELRVLSQENVVLLSLKAEEIGLPGASAGRGGAVFHTSAFSSWRTEIRTGQTYGRKELAGTGLFAVCIIGLTAAASLLFAWLFTVYLMRPVQRLTEGMARVGKGDFDINLNEDTVDRDLRQIFLGFNTMVAEIQTLIRTVQEEKLLVKSAQLEALRYQINPHFLYNTLQTMDAIGEVREVEEVRIIARSLGKLFRYNIQGASEVYLYEELDQLDNYFSVEQIRFGDKIAWEFLVPPETRECRVLKFILQPLIENAVVHGFRSMTRRGFVRISVRLWGPDLEIAVEDNGTGMTDDRYRAVIAALSGAAGDEWSPVTEGFLGILNVHRRIVNYYGTRYGLRYERNRDGPGLTALLLLPAAFRPIPAPAVSRSESGGPPGPEGYPTTGSR